MQTRSKKQNRRFVIPAHAGIQSMGAGFQVALRLPGMTKTRQHSPLFFLILLALSSACASSNLPSVTLYPANAAPVRVPVEIADTPTKRNFGLMYRRDLPASSGMLFLFPHEEPQSFWMKNTPLPLDIIFINASRIIVSIAANTAPFSETPLPSDAPAQFVLEVHAGFCRQHGITVGSRVELPNVQIPRS